MVDERDTGDRIEERSDLGDDDAGLYEFWIGQEAIAEKEEQKWVKQGRKIVQRYRDERPESTKNTHQFNILWSNVQTLIPTLYGRTPEADVRRRFTDDDPTGRLASTLMERALEFSIDAFDFDEVMESVVEDRLLPGRGTARVLYVPHFGDEIKDPDAQDPDEFEEEDAAPVTIDSVGDEDEEEAEPPREVVYEEAVMIYVFWEDYREGPARTWREVPWVRYRSYLTRDELVTRFGKEKGEQVELDFTPKGTPDGTKDDPPPDLFKKAQVFEFWDKSKKEVVWLAPGTPDLILDQRPDPLKLPDFFPSPSPLRSTSTNDKRIPVADYVEYQDQARELDTLTARIDRLTRALKVAGVYAGDEKQTLQQLLDEGTENKLIPVHDAAGWTDKGGIKGIIEWLPIEQIAETLIQLYSARDKVKALLYELTGIGDIMRGNTEPDETAAAQKLKANFSTRRVSPQQRKVAKFARDSLRIMGAVIAEHFSAKTISLITGFPQLDPVPPLPPKPQQPMLPPPMPVGPQPQLNGGGAAPIPAAVPPYPPAAIPGGPPAPPSNGAGPPGAPPQAPPPNPAMQQYQQQMAQWTQAAQAQAKVIQANQKKQQEFDAAVQLIKSDGVHGFRIDIEADSTIAIDEAEDQENRTEFMRQFIPLLEQVVPIAQGNPAMAALAKEITLFAVRGFKIARNLEETIANAFDTIAGMPPPQPKGGAAGPDSPADLALRGKQIQADDNKTNAQLQIAREKNAIEIAKLGQSAHDNAAELASKEMGERMEHGLNIAKEADESSFRRERAGALEAKEARGLT